MSRAKPETGVEIRGYVDYKTRERVRDYCATHGNLTVDAINSALSSARRPQSLAPMALPMPA